MTYKCVFCTMPTDNESLEHILQSALGCRCARRDLICGACNNAFSEDDEALATQFAMIRNALLVWSGRNDPPPTLRNAGEHNGVPYDLAPGFVPVFRRSVRRMSEGKLEVIVPNEEKAAEQAEHLCFVGNPHYKPVCVLHERRPSTIRWCSPNRKARATGVAASPGRTPSRNRGARGT